MTGILRQAATAIYMSRCNIKSIRWLGLLVVALSACVPVFRSEYLSPSWQGSLVDGQSGQPLVGVEVTDLYTQEKATTDQQGHFTLPPATSEFSFKLPAASMAGVYQIEVALPNTSVRFTGRRLAVTSEPSEFDIEAFPILPEITLPFRLATKDTLITLPKSMIDDCGAPLLNAISLANSARLYKKLLADQQNLGVTLITLQHVESAYFWAEQSWGYAGSVCFKQNYEQSQFFSTFVTMFYDEARMYSLAYE
ncbi:MAG: hypothetical protein ABJJ44_04305 [Paraglaciecola sp.]|uniref:hypothetical protein n=1 Tax=Paraglaciecola sp. TaxID=1920173 RepID=UPI00329823AD